MNIFSKRTQRAWEALNIRYPIIQILETNSYLFYFISASFLSVLAFSLFWTWEIPQRITNTVPITGVPDNLFSTIIEISIIAFLVAVLIFLKIFLGTEGSRISIANYRTIGNDLILPLNIEEGSVNISFSKDKSYKLPDFIEAFWRWSRVNREEYFLVEAGSLDVAKLTLRSVTFTNNFDGTNLILGQTSFFDIFFTHYCPDLTVSRVPNSDKEEQKTMRWLLSGSLLLHYLNIIKRIKAREIKYFSTPDYLPSPMGMSGIALLEVGQKKFVILRKRNTGDVAARGVVEWSFAGLFESTDWLHTNSIDFRMLIHKELCDELLQYSSTLNSIEFSLKLIGIVINELYLFQPELFSLCSYKCTELQLIKIRTELENCPTEKIWITEMDTLENEFLDVSKCKNLCIPGLFLLNEQFNLA